MDLDQLLATLGLTQDDLDAIGQAGVYDENSAMVGHEMGRAHELQTTPMPEGRQAGGTFVAANPLEFAASSMARIKGDQRAEEAMQQQHALIEALRGGLQAGSLAGARQRLGPQGGAGGTLKQDPYGDESQIPYFLGRP